MLFPHPATLRTPLFARGVGLQGTISPGPSEAQTCDEQVGSALLGPDGSGLTCPSATWLAPRRGGPHRLSTTIEACRPGRRTDRKIGMLGVGCQDVGVKRGLGFTVLVQGPRMARADMGAQNLGDRRQNGEGRGKSCWAFPLFVDNVSYRSGIIIIPTLPFQRRQDG